TPPWILNPQRPLYSLLKETLQQGATNLIWEPEHIKAFKTLKGALLQAPALSLPTEKEFNLFVTEGGGIALGMVTQKNGPIQQPVAYLSKELDVVSRRWPHCLRVIAAVTAHLSNDPPAHYSSTRLLPWTPRSTRFLKRNSKLLTPRRPLPARRSQSGHRPPCPAAWSS
uniref:Reverse transcriptase/retrotransposon-derived protein RNase H-like domain-containing protein n=1 Tax=Sciurus vulgaris TaxID=55149 RepID=A0A8D2CTI7_SCIVU